MLAPRHILDVKKQQLREAVLAMFDAVDDASAQAVACLDRPDALACTTIIANDSAINERRRVLEQDCLVAIASQQPVAHDLREIVAAMRIATELERMGDYAADIATNVLRLQDMPLPPTAISLLDAMATECRQMLAAVRIAYVQADVDQACECAARDVDIDNQLNDLSTHLLMAMHSDPNLIDAGTRLLWIAHSLERCGDRITNIAEQIVFMVDNDVVNLN